MMLRRRFELEGIQYLIIEQRVSNTWNCLAIGINQFSIPKWFTKEQMDNAVFLADVAKEE